MQKNDDIICSMWIVKDGSWDIPSCSTVTHLDIGDQVKVTGDDTNPAGITSDRNGFSGILIYAD